MVNELRLLIDATRAEVSNINEPYEEYRTDLVNTFSRVLQILREESTTNAQRREITELLKQFVVQMNKKMEAS